MATLAVLVALVASAAAVFDRTIEGYLAPLIVNQTTAGTYAFLDPSWYEGLDILPMSYERNVRTVGDFEGWKREFSRADLSADMHRPSRVDVLESSARDGYALSKMVLDGQLIVWEALPDRPNGKAVVVTPGTGHGGARDVMGVPSEYSFSYYHGDIGPRLARAGYAVYAPELTGYGERQVDVGSACAGPGADVTRCSFDVFSNSLALYGISTYDMHVKESAKAFSHALSAHDSVAVAGLSYGCGAAMSTAHANPDDVGAVVLASCIGRSHEWPMSAGIAGGGQNLHAEPVDSVRALAPIPVHLSYGQLDLGLGRYEADHGDVGRMVAEAYDLVGAPGSLDYVVHGGGHEYDVDSVIAFLDGAY